MYYIIDEQGQVFKTLDEKAAAEASDDDTNLVIDADRQVVLFDREATRIEVWEPPEDDEGGDDSDDEGSDD